MVGAATFDVLFQVFPFLGPIFKDRRLKYKCGSQVIWQRTTGLSFLLGVGLMVNYETAIRARPAVLAAAWLFILLAIFFSLGICPAPPFAKGKARNEHVVKIYVAPEEVATHKTRAHVNEGRFGVGIEVDVPGLSLRTQRLAELPDGSLKELMGRINEELAVTRANVAHIARLRKQYRKLKIDVEPQPLPAMLLLQRKNLVCSIDLSGQDLDGVKGPYGADGILLLAAFLRRAPRIHTLKLSGCSLGPPQLTVLAEGIREKMRLTYERQEFGQEGLQPRGLTMDDVTRVGALTNLDLSENRLCGVWYAHGEGERMAAGGAGSDIGVRQGVYDPSGVEALTSALRHNRDLTALNLAGNRLGTNGLVHVATMLHAGDLLARGALTALDLSGNSVCGITFHEHLGPYVVLPPLSLQSGWLGFVAELREAMKPQQVVPMKHSSHWERDMRRERKEGRKRQREEERKQERLAKEAQAEADVDAQANRKVEKELEKVAKKADKHAAYLEKKEARASLCEGMP